MYVGVDKEPTAYGSQTRVHGVQTHQKGCYMKEAKDVRFIKRALFDLIESETKSKFKITLFFIFFTPIFKVLDFHMLKRKAIFSRFSCRYLEKFYMNAWMTY